MKTIYLIGALKNPEVPKIAKSLRSLDCEVFDDWHAAGPDADDFWRDYETAKGHSYQEALKGHPAKHVFTFDEFHLNRAHAGILVYPAGKSGHIELGYLAGQGKPTFMLLDEVPKRYDVMKQFASGGMFSNEEDLLEALSSFPWPKFPDMPQMYQHEVMWLAGLLEGEGSFSIGNQPTPRLTLQMTDKDVVKKASEIMGSSLWHGSPTVTGKDIWITTASGLRGIEWMRILKPYMGVRRKQQIVDTVSKWLERRGYHKQDQMYWSRVFGL